MTEPVLHADPAPDVAGRRHPHGDADVLILRQIDPATVIDDPGAPEPLQLLTFGAMREACPHCKDVHLRLVLQQTNVRAPHLLCPRCDACFDACFGDGRSAFTL